MPSPRRQDPTDEQRWQAERDDFYELLSKLVEIVGQKPSSAERAKRDASQKKVGDAVAGLTRRVDPRLTAYRDAHDPRQNEGLPKHAVGNRKARAGVTNAEGAVSWAPFTPALIADSVQRPDHADRHGMGLAATFLAPGAGKVKQGVRLASSLIGSARGLPPQAALAASLPLALGASEAAAEGDFSEREELLASKKSLMESIAQKRAILERESKTGFGPKAQAVDAALRADEARLAEIDDKIRAPTASEQAQMEGDRYKAIGGGLVAGGAVSLLPTALSLVQRRGAANKLNALARRAETIGNATPTSRVVGTPQGDELASVVNEAYRTGGAKMPFGRRGGAVVPRGGPHDDAIFGNKLIGGPGSMRGDFVIPAGVAAEGAYSMGLGSGYFGGDKLSDGDRRVARNLGMSSLAAATGFKGGRIVGKMGLPKGRPEDRAAINAARTRIEREATPMSNRRVEEELRNVRNHREVSQARLNATRAQAAEPEPTQAERTAERIAETPPRRPSIRERAQRALPSRNVRRSQPNTDHDLVDVMESIGRTLNSRDPSRR